jgi:hypothetical protein
MKKIWIWDIETLDIFTSTFLDRDSDEVRTFVISKSKDERESLFIFLDTEVAGLIGFNSIYFDAQVIEYMYRNPNCSAEDIRRYAGIITENNDRRVDVPEWRLRHKHLDLFKALSLSVKAKRTGLKWCEYMLDLDNIEDMPSQGEGNNWEEMVLSYNYNDVLSTKKLYEKYKYEIELRKALTLREGVNLMNSTEPDMAKKLFGKYLSEAMNIPLNDLRSMQTNRIVVYVKDIIFPYILFQTDKLKQVYNEFNKLALKENDKFEFEVDINGIKVKYGLGGLHGSIEKKIVSSDKEYIIKTCDVKSFYPNLAIRNKLHPAHIPQETFCNLYESIYNERINIPKSDPRNYILKILLNATYGLSNDQYSFLRDRQFTLAICINGQLCLSMLFEKLLSKIPNSKLLMVNTDGFELLIPRQYEELYLQICKDWEKLTQFELEFDNYNKLIVNDVNNYISIFESGKTKCKGSFEFENIPLHKNKSHNIIPIAVYNYFVKGIGVEDTIYNHRNIFDFCAGVKASRSPVKGKSWFELQWIDKDKISTQKLSKTVRYFISKKGKYLFKAYEDGTSAHVEAPLERKAFKKDWKVTYFNKAYYPNDFKEYDIDYVYYIHKAKDIIFNIEGNVGQQTINF